MRQRGFLTVAWTLLLVGVTACQGAAPSGTQANPIPVGAIVSLTGNLAPFGTDMLAGVQVYVEQINAKGGINGRPIRLIEIDDNSQPDQALAAAKRLVEQEKVVAIVGPDSTAVSASAQPYADQAKVAMIGCICLVGKMSPYTFSPFPLIGQAVDGANFGKKRGVTKIGMLTQAGSLGDVRKAVDVPILEKEGMQVVGFEQMQPADTDATALLARLRSNGAQMIYLAANGGLAAIAIKNFKSMNYNGFMWTWSGNASGAFINLLADSGDVPFVQGLKVLVYKDLPDSDPDKARLTEFAQAYVTKTSRQPAVYSAVGYDAMWSLAEAIKSGGVDATKVRDALETQSMQLLNGKVTRSADEHNGVVPAFLTLKVDVAAKKFVVVQ